MTPGGLAVAYNVYLNVDTCQQPSKRPKDLTEHPVSFWQQEVDK